MENNIFDIVTAVGSVLTPTIVAIFSVVGWKYKQAMERKIELEKRLRDDRVDVYNKILEPFIIMLMSDEAWKSDPKNKNKDRFALATVKLLSVDYRRTAFSLSLVGEDNVVKSYNNLMQYFFRHSAASDFDVRKVMSLLGTFLLEIRRSIGNEATKMGNMEMLEWFITDARDMK